MSVSVPLSLLDLARVVPGDSGPADAIARSVRNAQLADELGYHRLWFSEHHNTRSIISSATTVEMGATFHEPLPMFHRRLCGVSSCQILISTLGGARGEGLRSTH